MSSVVIEYVYQATPGATLDGLNSDAAFNAWRAKSTQSGLGRWVRSNQSYEIPI